MSETSSIKHPFAERADEATLAASAPQGKTRYVPYSPDLRTVDSGRWRMANIAEHCRVAFPKATIRIPIGDLETPGAIVEGRDIP